jgi:Zn-dependent peptidase ImmA (M78 family)/predicted secreted protein
MYGRSMSPLQKARAQGSQAALRELVRLKIGFTSRIDVFSIIETAGVWLMFQPCKQLYGAYMRDDESGTAGIIINSNHPPSLQNFTAAHEYGHFILKHEPNLDDDQDIQSFDTERSLQEAAAQAFATNFLMPLPLVNHLLKQMGMAQRLDSLTPQDVYLLSLELGVSYRATITQLVNLKKISWDAAAKLRKLAPKAIKTEIGFGVVPQNARADLWPLDSHDSGRIVYPRIGDEIRVTLPEMPSTGYTWNLIDSDVADWRNVQGDIEPRQEDSLALIGDEFRARSGSDAQGRLGAGGMRSLLFQVLRPGHHTLRLAKRRPWQHMAPVESYEVQLSVSARPTGERELGLSDYFQHYLAA